MVDIITSKIYNYIAITEVDISSIFFSHSLPTIVIAIPTQKASQIKNTMTYHKVNKQFKISRNKRLT